MPQHDFQPLYDQYDAVIAHMPEEFSSHEFILRLAQQNQREYVEALYSYRETAYGGGRAPFRAVHSILSSHLSECPQVEFVGQRMSTDIFGGSRTCAFWRKR